MPAKKAVKTPVKTPIIVPPPVPEKVYRPRAPRVPPPNPTVVAFQQQLVPLVEKREIIQSHVRQSQRAVQEAQATLGSHQQALQDTEAAINYRLNMIAQLTGQPAPSFAPQVLTGYQPTQFNEARLARDIYSQGAPIYDGPEVNLLGNPNIPDGVTSIPAPQNLRYSSGYVPSGPDNPRSESAVDVRDDPQTRDVMFALAKARTA